jgi:hypothetical protein
MSTGCTLDSPEYVPAPSVLSGFSIILNIGLYNESQFWGVLIH